MSKKGYSGLEESTVTSVDINNLPNKARENNNASVHMNRFVVKRMIIISASKAQSGNTLVYELPKDSILEKVLLKVDVVTLGNTVELSVGIGTSAKNDDKQALASSEINLLKSTTVSNTGIFGDVLTELGTSLSTAGNVVFYTGNQNIYFNFNTSGSTVLSGTVYILYSA